MTVRTTPDPPDHPARSVPYRVARGQLRLVSTLGANERAQFVRRVTLLAPKPQARLALDVDQEVLRVLADHKHLLPSVQRTLAERARPQTLEMLARHPHLDPGVAELLRRKGGGLLVALATSPGTPGDLLDQLLTSRLSAVSGGALRNPNTPGAVERLLATPHDLEALAMAAANRHTSAETLRELAQTGHPRVLAAVAANPATPADVLDDLVTQPGTSLIGLARNPSITPHCVQTLKREQDVAVRMRLAANPATPGNVLVELDEDGGAPRQVQTALAKNPATPRHLLAKYLQDGGKTLVLSVLYNPGYDEELLHRTQLSALHPQQLEMYCVAHPHWETFRTLAQNWRGTVGDLFDACEALA